MLVLGITPAWHYVIHVGTYSRSTDRFRTLSKSGQLMFDTIWSKFVSPELNEKFYVFLAETTNSNQVAKRTVGFHTLFGGTINPCEAKC